MLHESKLVCPTNIEDLLVKTPWRDDKNNLKKSRMSGVSYVDFLAFVQTAMNSSRYLEIGVRSGASLAAMKGRAVGIDPNYRNSLDAGARESGAYLYKMTSDSYFQRHNPHEDLNGPIQVAFVDGMHHFEYVVRDVLNVQRHAAAESLILLHDCIPWSFSMTKRLEMDFLGQYAGVRGNWTGDVWKAIPVLQELLPFMQVNMVDCAPTGIVILSIIKPDYKVIPHRVEHLIMQAQEKYSTECALWTWLETQDLVDSEKIIGDSDALKKLLGLSRV